MVLKQYCPKIYDSSHREYYCFPKKKSLNVITMILYCSRKSAIKLLTEPKDVSSPFGNIIT
jgi:hypothetical protein